MKYLFSLILLFFLTSCQDYSEFKNVEGTITINPAHSKVESIEITKWRVGPRRKQLVSKGVEIRIRFPVLEKDHLEYLLNESDVNAWLVTVRKNTMTRSEVMERAYIPLIVPGTEKSKITTRIRQMKSGYIRIYYAAAAVSSRFADLSCPAFKHNKLISSVELEQTASQVSPIIFRPYRKDRVLQKVNEFNYRPEPVNGDVSLEGNYTVEIGLYNFKKKMLLSNSYRLPQIAKVLREKEVDIKGCTNFKIPDFKDDSQGIEDFKFGR